MIFFFARPCRAADACRQPRVFFAAEIADYERHAERRGIFFIEIAPAIHCPQPPGRYLVSPASRQPRSHSFVIVARASSPFSACDCTVAAYSRQKSLLVFAAGATAFQPKPRTPSYFFSISLQAASQLLPYFGPMFPRRFRRFDIIFSPLSSFII